MALVCLPQGRLDSLLSRYPPRSPARLSSPRLGYQTVWGATGDGYGREVNPSASHVRPLTLDGTPIAICTLGSRDCTSARDPGSREMALRGVNDYIVAAYPRIRGRHASDIPESKHHAYLEDASTTACGFGLGEMQRFSNLRFLGSHPSVRCAMCDRIVRAAAR